MTRARKANMNIVFHFIFALDQIEGKIQQILVEE